MDLLERYELLENVKLLDNNLNSLSPLLINRLIDKLRYFWRAFVDSLESTAYKINIYDREKAASAERETNGKASEVIFRILQKRNVTVRFLAEILLKMRNDDCLLCLFKPKPLEILNEPEINEINEQEGKVLQLTVFADCLPFPKYQWYKNDLCISNQTSATLCIKFLQKSDSGKYHCIVQQLNYLTQVKISMRSKTINVIVSDNPDIDLMPMEEWYTQTSIQENQVSFRIENLSVDLQRQIIDSRDEIRCKIVQEPCGKIDQSSSFRLYPNVDSENLLKCTWFKDGGKILESNKSTTFQIKKAIPEHDGVYSCIVEYYHNVKVTSDKHRVTISRPITSNHSTPEIILFNDLVPNKKVSAGNIETCEVIAAGFPTISFKWFINNAAFESENNNDKRFRVESKIYECVCKDKIEECECILNEIPNGYEIRISTLYIDTNFGEIECKIQCQIECDCHNDNAGKASRLSSIQDFISESNGSKVKVSEKLAIIFGVAEYHCDEEIGEISVEESVKKLNTKLETLGFKTFSFINCNLEDTRKVIQLIKDMIISNTYLFFYFLGHGFTDKDTTYLCTKDSSKNSFRDCITDKQIVNMLYYEIISSKHELLNATFIFETCRMKNHYTNNLCDNEFEYNSVTEDIDNVGRKNGLLKIYPTNRGSRAYFVVHNNDNYNFVDILCENMDKTFGKLISSLQEAICKNVVHEIRSQILNFEGTIQFYRSLADAISHSPDAKKKENKRIMKKMMNRISHCDSMSQKTKGYFYVCKTPENCENIKYRLTKKFSNVLKVEVLWTPWDGLYNSFITINENMLSEFGVYYDKHTDSQSNIMPGHYRVQTFTFRGLELFNGEEDWYQEFFLYGSDSYSDKAVKKLEFKLFFGRPLIMAIKLRERPTSKKKLAEENTEIEV